MKTKMTIFLLVSISIAVVLLSGCFKTIPLPASETTCTTDADCACGTHIETGACFAGNKEFVNVEKQCPDFCTGIAAMFETRCVDKNCKIVRIEAPATCTIDDDCVGEQCCHATSCINKEKKGVCTLLCTNVCQPGTLDCGGSCTCVNGECKANLNNLTTEITPPVPECSTDSDCIPGECCHPTTCRAGKEMPECAAVLCSAECEPGTLDCGGSCTCDDGECTAHLNSLAGGEIV